jgi:hypothetical protein
MLVDNYGIERNLTRSWVGFWLKIELNVFVYDLGFLVLVKMKLLQTSITRLILIICSNTLGIINTLA